MTAAFLQSELLSLISDSKRKQSDVRTAAEKSLADLKSISVTSETQLAGDLLRKLQFIDPFVLACNSKYAKLAVTGTICLQRLVASRALPKARLGDVLDAFQEASHQGLDVQLKILQALPSLLQLYATELYGQPLAKILSLCAGLAGSKTGMVNSTATATFQQLITTVFERGTDPGENGHEQQDLVNGDATKVFADMCMIVQGQAPQFLSSQGVSQNLALEVVESCLSNENLDILGQGECMIACQNYLVPGLVGNLEKSNSFAIFCRCLRLTRLLVEGYIDDLLDSLSGAINLVLDWLDRGSAASWKRILCLELMSNVCSDFQLLREVHRAFDETENRRHVIRDLAAILVRMASEDPGLIGLGRQSTMPTNSGIDGSSNGTASVDMSALDAVGSVMQASSNATGISTLWSTMKSPLIEQTERQSPPDIPETYTYTLVLACVAAISEGLSKFIMPLSVPPRPTPKTQDLEEDEEDSSVSERKNSLRARKYHRLLNPLKREDSMDLNGAQVCAEIIEDCWPAILAICSTFLNSALDSHFYHIVVRTVQKLAQVSGVMELNTPRDAFLTTLAKVSVPLNAPSLISALYGNKVARRYDLDNDLEHDSASIKSPATNTARPSIDFSRQTLNVRNLLCLRALLNLGIALGPTLSDTSWFIVIQALQQVDALMSVSPTAKSAGGSPTVPSADGEGQTSLATEIAAVGTASKRMIESTRTFSDSTLATLLQSVFKMIDDLIPNQVYSLRGDENGKHNGFTVPGSAKSHKSSRSVSGVFASSKVLRVEADFVLKTVSDLARVNLYRFASISSKSCSWDLVVTRLMRIVAGQDIDADLRLQSASIIDVISMETARLLEKQSLDSDTLDTLQQTCLSSLSEQITVLYRPGISQLDAMSADIEIHRRLLEALENIVSHAGDSLTRGWRIVFEILQLTIQPTTTHEESHQFDSTHAVSEEAKLRTVPPAFRTVQMIVSDFLESIDPESLWVLVQLLPLFGRQENDVNISLTTTSLFWNINGLILRRAHALKVSEDLSTELSPVDDPDSVATSEASTLWFATMMHLAELCGDYRNDVRNGALRVMLRIFEASSEQLTPGMWNASVRKVLLPLLRSYSTTTGDQVDWHASYAHLLAGTINLISTNLPSIIATQGVQETWQELVSILQSMLEQKTLAGHSSVFSAMTALLQAFTAVEPRPRELVLHFLQLWFDYHPANITPTEEPSSQAFVDHAKVFVEIDRCAHEALINSEPVGQRPYKFVMRSTNRTVMSAQQNRYADDVKRLAPEQEAAVENLKILRTIMLHQKHEYSVYVLGLIGSALARHMVAEKTEQAAEARTIAQEPKLIAFMYRCIELLRSNIPEIAEDNHWITDLAIPETLGVLKAVISSKYTDIPTNNGAPAWKIATTTSVEIAEALQTCNQQMQDDQIRSLADILPATVEAVLYAPALESKSSTLAEEQITADESFDIDHFMRLQKALVPLISRNDFPETARKQYVLTLFNSSLISKPWFGDSPPDLLHRPLEKFSIMRAGSIHEPDFHIRRSISYKALDALFDLVSRDHLDVSIRTDSVTSTRAATAAAPYLLLRIAHALKTFIADQRLRQLNPPPEPVQEELTIILTKSLQLRCQDKAFTKLSGRDTPRAVTEDGKSHLRILYPLVIQLKDLWASLPRLKVCAWQDDQSGLAIQRALTQWSEVLAENWAIQ